MICMFNKCMHVIKCKSQLEYHTWCRRRVQRVRRQRCRVGERGRTFARQPWHTRGWTAGWWRTTSPGAGRCTGSGSACGSHPEGSIKSVIFAWVNFLWFWITYTRQYVQFGMSKWFEKDLEPTKTFSFKIVRYIYAKMTYNGLNTIDVNDFFVNLSFIKKATWNDEFFHKLNILYCVSQCLNLHNKYCESTIYLIYEKSFFKRRKELSPHPCTSCNICIWHKSMLDANQPVPYISSLSASCQTIHGE